MAELKPLTPEERMKMRQRMLPSFLKDVETFHRLSAEILAYGSRATLDKSAMKTIRGKSKDLEGRVDRLLAYILDGERALALPALNYSKQTPEQRVELLGPIVVGLDRRLREAAGNKRTLDASLFTGVIKDQSVKLLSRSFREEGKPN